ncbi:MAG: hypothetical protein ACTH7G_03595, partial [Leuconostoc mesenteroides]
ANAQLLARRGYPYPLRVPKEANENILVSLFVAKEGQKKWQGKIADLNKDGLTLTTTNGRLPLTFDEIAKAILDVQF